MKTDESLWYKLIKSIRKVKEMLQKIRKFIMVGITGMIIASPGLAPALVGTVSAESLSNTAGSNIKSGLCSGIMGATGGSCTGNGTAAGSTLTAIARKVINILSIIVGIVAVIMIIIGGFRYVTSGGASDKVGGAKNTLIYAIIGLIIVALAQAIVHFVLNQSTSAVSS